MSQTKFNKLIAARDKRIEGYIKNNLTAQEIGDREGLERDYALLERNRIAAKLGLQKARKGPKDPKAFGMTEDSRALRSGLAELMWNWKREKDLHHLEIARDLGITMRQQDKAHSGSPPTFNWKLSQMERLAKALGMSVNKLLVLSMRRELLRLAGNRKVGDVVNEWIYGD